MSHAQSKDTKASKADDSQAADPDWLDEVFDLLSNQRRRIAIQHIIDNECITKRELVEFVTAKQYRMDRGEVSGSDERKTVNSSLHQTHLPRLERAGVIERDETGSRISLGPRSDDLAEWISMIDGENDSLGSLLKDSLSVLC